MSFTQRRATQGIPPEPKLPGTRQPSRKLGVVDLIRFTVGSKAAEIDKMQIEDHLGDTDRTPTKRELVWMKHLEYHQTRATQLTKALKARGLEVQQTHHGNGRFTSRLQSTYEVRNKIRNERRALQKDRAYRLKILYNEALLTTLGMDAAAVGKYLRVFKMRVERI